MSGKRKIVDAKQDAKGNISHVKLSGNQNFTPVEKAIEMAKRGDLENAHAVQKQGGGEYLRSNPDDKSVNNLDSMAES